MRNVNRNKQVKSTQGTTYVYSLKSVEICKTIFDNDSSEYITYNLKNRIPEHKTCQICRTGAFASEHDKLMHFATKKHQQMFDYDLQWSNYLLQESSERLNEASHDVNNEVGNQND